MQISIATLRLWQLISPALPIGSFSYSQALEYAIDSGTIKSKEQLETWLSLQIKHGLAQLDLPILLRINQACHKNDKAVMSYWNQTLLAYRESAEFYAEDCQVGHALRRLLIDLDITDATNWQTENVSYICMYAIACQHWQIDNNASLAGFLWAWCENMVAAAVKLLPMGQTDGQRMLMALSENIDDACKKAKQLSDDEVGGTLPGLAMASAYHETQYSRLFRS